jgi:ADP-ribose pyrophosphatase
MLEFPAGKIDAGETSLATGQRELAEEAGYSAEHWKPLGTIHPEIGYSTEFIDLFEATGLTHVGSRLDEGEFLDIVAMAEDELLATYDCGGFTDGKSIAALFAWRRSRGLR